MRTLPVLLASSILACHGHGNEIEHDAVAPLDGGVCIGSASSLPTHGLSSVDGDQVVYDSNQNLYWLADANLAAKQTFGVAGINASGSMTYATAVSWVAAMNAYGGSGYLGHSDWQLPTTPGSDSTCSTHNMGDDFGRGCSNSAMGSVFYVGMELTYPSPEVSIPPDEIGPFTNLEPSLYWTLKVGSGDAGPQTFSFSNGFIGANTQYNFLYVLPMIPHAIGPAPAGSGLVPYLGGKAVYDTGTGITWLADANYAATETFGLTGSGSDGYPLISSNGAMEYATAGSGSGGWIAAMNASDSGSGYLGANDWQLPATGSDLATLYGHLGYTQGQSVSTLQNCVGPFENVQPYLYWSCERDPMTTPESACSGSAVPATGYEWSFNFGAGFEGTDLVSKELYVMVYYAGS